MTVYCPIAETLIGPARVIRPDRPPLVVARPVLMAGAHHLREEHT